MKMIDVSELRILIRHEQQPLTDIEQIFRALVGYPSGEEIHNATRADLAGALEAACESLIGDDNTAPDATADLVIGYLDVAPANRTYGGLAAAIREAPDRLLALLKR
jgi:hypothetical protein